MTIDVGSSESSSSPNEYSSTTLRSIYACNDTVDVALFTDPEEIYLMKVILASLHDIFLAFNLGLLRNVRVCNIHNIFFACSETETL